MKEYRFRTFIILLAVALSVYLLHYTYADYINTKEIEKEQAQIKRSIMQANPNIDQTRLERVLDRKTDSLKAANPSFAKDRAKRIKLGLDLQGGMYIVMEVNTTKLLEKLAKDPDPTFKQTLAQAEKQAQVSNEEVVTTFTRMLQNRGIRLSRYFGTMRESDNDIVSKLKKQSEDAVTRAVEIIRNRVDQYGVSEPSIQRQGERRIIVELPGVAKEEEAKQLLQGQALLEFKLLKDPQFEVPLLKKIDEVIAGKPVLDSTNSITAKTVSDSAKAVNDSSDAKLSKEEYAKKHPFLALLPQYGGEPIVSEQDKPKIEQMLSRPDVQRVLPSNVEFLFAAKPIVADGKNYYAIYLVNREAELTGGSITDAQSNIDPQTSRPIVTMQMNSEGARDWARITGANIDKRIAIVLDNLVYSAPVVRNKITGGNSQIDGMKDLQEAKLLEIVLKAGALPAPVDIIEQRSVGPSLGEDSVYNGLNSAVIGFLMVSIFMIVIYSRTGIIADVALFFAILFILGCLAGFSATLTLPGIAGIVLTMGMAVDANVLIYERIREELALGKTLRAAVDSGFKFSFSTVIDSHVTTLITGIILYQFGTGPVQGFALTLIIGIFTSLFGALVITRVILDYMVAKGHKITLG